MHDLANLPLSRLPGLLRMQMRSLGGDGAAADI